jgi:hypothetical protein
MQGALWQVSIVLAVPCGRCQLFWQCLVAGVNCSGSALWQVSIVLAVPCGRCQLFWQCLQAFIHRTCSLPAFPIEQG